MTGSLVQIYCYLLQDIQSQNEMSFWSHDKIIKATWFHYFYKKVFPNIFIGDFLCGLNQLQVSFWSFSENIMETWFFYVYMKGSLVRVYYYLLQHAQTHYEISFWSHDKNTIATWFHYLYTKLFVHNFIGDLQTQNESSFWSHHRNTIATLFHYFYKTFFPYISWGTFFVVYNHLQISFWSFNENITEPLFFYVCMTGC